MTSSLRIVSYNFKALQMDAAALGAVLRAEQADVVAVQEPPRFWGARRRLREFAHACGFEVVVYGNYPFGGATTALLATPEVAARVIDRGSQILPFDPWLWPSLWREHRIWPSRRGYAYLTTTDVTVISIHLGLNPEEREVHRNIILNRIHALGARRCIVAGDLNERPGGPSWLAFERRLRDVVRLMSDESDSSFHTFPSQRARLRIDSVFVGTDFAVEEVHVPDGPDVQAASDHLPTVVRVRLPS